MLAASGGLLAASSALSNQASLQGPLPVVDDYKKLSWILSVVGAAPSKKCRVVGRSSRKSGLS